MKPYEHLYHDHKYCDTVFELKRYFDDVGRMKRLVLVSHSVSVTNNRYFVSIVYYYVE